MILPVSGEGGPYLSEVVVGENETFEAALKRFNKRVQQDGVLAEARRREHYEKPSVKRKKKEAAKRRKSTKTTKTATKSATKSASSPRGR